MYYNVTGRKQTSNKNAVAHNHTYTLTNLRPYTEYSLYVTAVRMIGDNNEEPLEGMKSRSATGKTLAGSK